MAKLAALGNTIAEVEGGDNDLARAAVLDSKHRSSNEPKRPDMEAISDEFECVLSMVAMCGALLPIYDALSTLFGVLDDKRSALKMEPEDNARISVEELFCLISLFNK